MSYAGYGISRIFQQKAETANILSYRRAEIAVDFHIPGFPHLIQTLREKFFDHVNAGLHDLVLARAILENPDRAHILMPALDAFDGASAEPGEMAAIKRELRRLFDATRAPDPQMPERIVALTEMTDREIDGRIAFLQNLARKTEISFVSRSDSQNLTDLHTVTDIRHMERTRRFLTDWFSRPVREWEDGQMKAAVTQIMADRLRGDAPLQADAFLDRAVITAAPIESGEMERARRQIADMTQGGAAIITGGANQKLIVH